MIDLNKALALELEYLRADLELLRQEVESTSLSTRQAKTLLDIMDTIQKNTFENN